MKEDYEIFKFTFYLEIDLFLLGFYIYELP